MDDYQWSVNHQLATVVIVYISHDHINRYQDVLRRGNTVNNYMHTASADMQTFINRYAMTVEFIHLLCLSVFSMIFMGYLYPLFFFKFMFLYVDGKTTIFYGDVFSW